MARYHSKCPRGFAGQCPSRYFHVTIPAPIGMPFEVYAASRSDRLYIVGTNRKTEVALERLYHDTLVAIHKILKDGGITGVQHQRTPCRRSLDRLHTILLANTAEELRIVMQPARYPGSKSNRLQIADVFIQVHVHWTAKSGQHTHQSPSSLILGLYEH